MSAAPATGRTFTPLGVVVAGTLGNCVSVTPAVHAVFGLFLIPISEEFGWPRAYVSGVLALLSIVTALCYPVIGPLADRFGARPLILIGNLTFAAALALLTTANGSLLQFYLFFALIAVTSSLPSSMIFAKLVTGWFDQKRGTMLGIVGGVGNGVGAAVLPVIAAMLLAAYSWREAYLGIALIIALVFPVLWRYVGDPPAAAKMADGSTLAITGLSLGEACRTPVFWMILTAIALGAGCMTAMFAHVVPVLAEHGVSTGIGTAVVSTFALVTAAWQVVMGWLLDRSRGPLIAVPFYFIPVVGLLMVERTTSLPLLLLAGALMGIGLGTQYGTLAYLVSRYFGLKAFGAICGLMYSVVMLTQGLTPPLMDVVFDEVGSYALALLAMEGTLVLGAILLALLPRYPLMAPVPAGSAVAALH